VAALPKGAGVEMDAIMVLKPQEYPASWYSINEK
jgi:hypothetical protein